MIWWVRVTQELVWLIICSLLNPVLGGGNKFTYFINMVIFKIWVTFFLTAPLATSCKCRNVFCTLSPRIHAGKQTNKQTQTTTTKKPQYWQYDVSRSPVFRLQNIELFPLNLYLYLNCSFCALIRQCNSQEMKSDFTVLSVQARLAVSLCFQYLC